MVLLSIFELTPANGVGGRNMLLCSWHAAAAPDSKRRNFSSLESCSAFAAAREWARSRPSCKLKRNDLDRYGRFFLLLFSSPSGQCAFSPSQRFVCARCFCTSWRVFCAILLHPRCSLEWRFVSLGKNLMNATPLQAPQIY